MKPKVESAIIFLKDGRKKAIITNLYDLVSAVSGKTVTQIVPNDQVTVSLAQTFNRK